MVRMDARCGRATGKSVRLVRQQDWRALAPVSVATERAGYLSGHIVADARLQSNERTGRTEGRSVREAEDFRKNASSDSAKRPGVDNFHP
jgi:hypothetical protein